VYPSNGKRKFSADATGEYVSAPTLQREFELSPTSLKTAALKGRVATKIVTAEFSLFRRTDVAACFKKRPKPLERARGQKTEARGL
jgi:hypothetical protein